MSTPARVSIRQVAEHAGVSRMTVSNVMRGRNGIVAPETMARVLAAVRELGYAPVPQPTIQGRHVETRTIGLVFDYIEIEDIWGAPTYRGMRAAARQLDYDLLTLLRERPEWMLDQEELQFLDRCSDGFIFTVPKERTRVLEALVQHQMPVVSCFVDDVPAGVATVVLDNAGAMQQAVRHLVGYGHRDIAHIAGSAERSDFCHRREGYEAAMRQAGLEPVVTQLTTLDDAGWLPEMQALLQNKRMTAVICANDFAALKIQQMAVEMGLSLPGDLSIIGMDDIPPAGAASLTTFRFSCEEIGHHAVRAVVRMIGGECAQDCSKVVPVEMVVRGSVTAPKSNEVSK